MIRVKNHINFRVFVINVSNNKAKQEHFKKEAKKINLKFDFFPAITPKDIKSIKNYYNPIITEKIYGRPLMDTEIACALSHITLWKQLQNDKEVNNYLILEDDVTIKNDFNEILNDKKFDKYGLIRLCGNKIHYHKRIMDLKNNKKLVEFSYGCLTGGAYRINKSVTQNLINYCLNLTQAIDIMMDRSFSHKVISYGVLPFPVHTDWHNNKNDPLFTDIGVRNSEYKKNITFYIKLIMKIERFKTSLLKRISILKLFLKNNVD